MSERTSIGAVLRRNRGYLVYLDTNANGRTEDATPDELYDAASSLVTAKRVLVAMAEDFGFTGPVRWKKADGYQCWRLTMTADEEG